MAETQDLVDFTYTDLLILQATLLAWQDNDKNTTQLMGSSTITYYKDTVTGEIYLKNTTSGNKSKLDSGGNLVDF